MAGSKREKQLARAKYERQQQRRAERAAKARQRNRIVAVVTVLVIVVGGIVWFGLSKRSEPTDTVATDGISASPTPELSASGSPSAQASAEVTPSGEATPEDTSVEAVPIDCAPPPATRADDLTWDAAPDEALEPGTAYDLTLQTNCGTIVIRTEPAKAPATVNSMVFLAQQGFFDATSCHRVTTAGIYVLQCGDPAGNGTGGPGYSVPDENLPAEGEANYPTRTVAMANAGPGTAGSQFFLVYDDTTLPPDYTVWGKIIKGLDVVQAVAGAGVEGGGTDGPPAQPIVIEKATATPV